MTNDNSSSPDSSVEANRRNFLGWTLKAGAIALPAVALASNHAEAGTKTTLSSKNKYGPLLPELYTGSNKRNFIEIQNDENTHVNAIESVLAFHGAAIPPAPTFQNLQATSYLQFAMLSATFENTGVRAYLGAVPYINDPNNLSFAGEIATIEAYHSGWLNTLINTPIAPGGESFSAPATQAQIVAAVTPFIANLNAPLPVISTTKSDANDLVILEFALILERLEQAYYNLNIPIFFP